MPSRIIKESICTSENLNMLTPNAEILFYRLMVNADDYGRYYGHPGIVKGHCFPLREDDIQTSEVGSWLGELELAGLIERYTVEGRQYIQFSKWDKHQTIRAKKSKFPPSENICKQMYADASKCPRIRNSYSYSYSDIEVEIGEDAIPTFDDVKAFAEEVGGKVDAKYFFDFYSPDWKDGEGKPIKNWKKLFMSWERRATDGRSSDSTESEDRFANLHYDNE